MAKREHGSKRVREPALGERTSDRANALARRRAIPATEAQNEFGRVLDAASRGEDIVITRHGVPQIVVVSADRYREMSERDNSVLQMLSSELDTLYEQMQTPQARAAMDKALRATPAELGQAALKAARRQRGSSRK